MSYAERVRAGWTRVTVELGPESIARLDEECRRLDASRTGVIRWLLDGLPLPEAG